MASRNKIEANKVIFEKLDSFCQARGTTISNAGIARWIETTEENRAFLIHAEAVNSLVLSPTLAIQRFDFEDRSYFVTAGFETVEDPEELIREDLNGSILTAFLSETDVRVTATPDEVRNVVEVGQLGEPEYNGHAFEQMASLFPNIQVYSTPRLVKEESEATFFLLCLADRRRVDHWIDEELANSLKSLASLTANAIPYRNLSRATLDIDPASLFLALYRTLESLYAREKTSILMTALAIKRRTWLDVAQSLEEHLGWYPREETSLENLLRHAKETTLESILTEFKLIKTEGMNLPAVTAKRIYALRNSLVHYRPFHQASPIPSLNWGRLCEAMISLVLEVSPIPS